MTSIRIYWQQRKAIFQEHFYSKDDDELYWKTYDKIVHSYYINKPARIIIVPNVAWRYCSKIQAKAYRQLDLTNAKRIFVFAPLIKSYIVKKCFISSFDSFLNPVFRTSVDRIVCAELEGTKMFDRLSWKADELELTFEAQLPFIATLLKKYPNKLRLVPIYVGELGLDEQKIYGAIFSKYLRDPENLFIFSTNFYNWGKYFDFTFKYPKDKTAIQTLNKLIMKGIEAIQPLEPEKYLDYCLFGPGKFIGQHLIGILIYAVQAMKNREIEKFNEMTEEQLPFALYTKFTLKFMDKGYSNNECTDEDHCFAYASASVVMTKERLIPQEPIPDAPLDKRN